MEHKFKPLFSDSIKEGRFCTVKNKPIFVGGEKFWINKNPSDVNDISKTKVTYNIKVQKTNMSEEEVNSYIRNSKEIKSRTGNIEENKWMFTLMKRARQV